MGADIPVQAHHHTGNNTRFISQEKIVVKKDFQ